MEVTAGQGTSADDAHPDPVAKLVAQLYYDRADVARISVRAAAAMDLVIAMVISAVKNARRDPG